MTQFLNESFAAILFVIILSVLFGLIQYFAAKAYAASQDKHLLGLSLVYSFWSKAINPAKPDPRQTLHHWLG